MVPRAPIGARLTLVNTLPIIPERLSLAKVNAVHLGVAVDKDRRVILNNKKPPCSVGGFIFLPRCFILQVPVETILLL